MATKHILCGYLTIICIIFYAPSNLSAFNLADVKLFVGDNCTTNQTNELATYNEQCINNTVACLSGKLLFVNRFCLDAASLGDQCDFNIQCSAGTTCYNHTCQCKGHEINVNGTDRCTNELYNEDCLSSEFCPTNSSCVSNGNAGRCICNSGLGGDKQHGYRCFKDQAIPIGEPCSADFQCLKATNNSVCDGECLCTDHYSKRTLSNGSVVCFDGHNLSLGDLCYQNNQCAHDSKCKGYRCQCQGEQIKVNGTDRCTIELNKEECSGSELCPPHSSCVKAGNSHKCICDSGFKGGNIYSSYECFERVVHVGGNCTNVLQCFDSNVGCVNNKCKCHGSENTDKNGTIYCVTNLFRECSVSEQCPTNSSCYDSNCRCALGFKYEAVGNKCVQDTRSLYERCEDSKDCKDLCSSCINNQCACDYYLKDIDVITGSDGNKHCRRNITDLRTSRCSKFDQVLAKHAECKNGSVVCQSGFRADKRSCHNDTAISIDEHCTADFQCLNADKNSKCRKGKCECTYFYQYVNSGNGSMCVKIKNGYDDYCDGNYLVCQDKYMYCSNFNCRCIHGFHYEDQNHTCTNATARSISIGDYCVKNYDNCIDPNSKCIDGKCRCNDGTVTVKGIEYCKAKESSKCLVSESCPEHSSCKDSKCKCHALYRSDFDHDCTLFVGAVSGIVTGIIAGLCIIIWLCRCCCCSGERLNSASSGTQLQSFKRRPD